MRWSTIPRMGKAGGDARPVVVHVMETLAVGRNLEDPKVKTDLAIQVLPLIEDIPSPIERDTYRQRLARLLRVSERALLQMATPDGALPARASAGCRQDLRWTVRQRLPRRKKRHCSYNLEAHCLGILLRRPDLLYQVDRQLQDERLARLTEKDFRHADHQAIFACC